jgi:tRNA-binding protein
MNANNQNEINWTDFEKIDIRVGTIIEVNSFPNAKKPAYKLHLDFGPDVGILKSSAQITAYYQIHDLVGKQILAVINFPKKQIGNFMSECLVLGLIGDTQGVVLITPDFKVNNGLKLA